MACVNDPLQTEVPSPCRDICRLNDLGICGGCGRSLGEIAEWPRANNTRRRLIRELARWRLALESETAQRGEFLDRGPH